VVTDAEPAWSGETGQASWIGERLAPFGAYVVTSVVPGGFEAYARVLHPAEEPLHGGDRVVRWAEVAAWSGLPLRPGSQFHSIALPRVRPGGEAPWTGQGPGQGSLYPPDTAHPWDNCYMNAQDHLAGRAHPLARWLSHRRRTRLMFSAAAGIVATVLAAAFGSWIYAPAIGWDATAIFFATTVLISGLGG
jgi:hypothetical protein